MLIDAHIHVWRAERAAKAVREGHSGPLSHSYEMADFAEHESRLTGVIVIESNRPEPGENQQLLDLAAKNPIVVGVVGRLPFHTSDFVDELDRILDKENSSVWRGPRFAFRSDFDGDWTPEATNNARHIAKHGRVLELLIPWQRFAEIPTNLPDIPIIVDHLGTPSWTDEEHREWRRSLRVLADIPNVFVKFSGYPARQSIRPYLSDSLDILGPRRLMFASNWPVNLVTDDYDSTVDFFDAFCSGLGSEDINQLRHRTACTAYGISPPGLRSPDHD